MEAHMASAGPSSPRRVVHYASATDSIMEASVGEAEGRHAGEADRLTLALDYDHSFDDVAMKTFDAYIDMGEEELSDYEEEEEEDDDDDITLLPTTRSKSLSPAKRNDRGYMQYSSGTDGSMPSPDQSRCTGRPQQRSPLIRLSAYIDDFLQCEEQDLPDEASLKDMCKEGMTSLSGAAQAFFTLSKGSAIVRAEVFSRIVTLVRSCANDKSTTKHSLVRTLSTVKDAEEGALDVESCSRFIKAIHRTVTRRDVCLDPFPLIAAGPATGKKRGAPGTTKSVKRARKALSEISIAQANRNGEQEQGLDALEPAESAASKNGLEDVASRLSDVAYTARAVECTLALLSLATCDEALQCDELISPTLQATRNITDNVLVPFVRASAGTATAPNELLSVSVEEINSSSHESSAKGPNESREHLTTIVTSLRSILAKIEALAATRSWQPSNYTVAVLVDSLVPIVNIKETGSSAACQIWSPSVAGIRLAALHTVSLLTAKSAEPESTINAVLDHIDTYSAASKRIKQTWLGSDRIQPLTVLIIRIIQDSAESRDRICARLQDPPADAPAEDDAEAEIGGIEQDDDARFDIEKLRHALDRPREMARLFAEGLLWRLKAKRAGRKGGLSETDIAGVFESITKDLLLVLFAPEWPGAALLVQHLARLSCSTLEDRTATPDLRGIALDYLGSVATAMRSSSARLKSVSQEMPSDGKDLRRFASIVEEHSMEGLQDISAIYGRIFAYLQLLNNREDVSSSAANFVAAQHLVELSCAHRKMNDVLSVTGDSQDSNEQARIESPFQKALERQISSTMSEAISDSSHGQAYPAKKDIASTRDLYERLVHTFNFALPPEVILDKLLEASEGPVAANRSKALRALSNISQVDETFLRSPEVRQAIQRCLLDESVNVRDGSVALLGKFVVANPHYLTSLFPSLRSKMDDSGLLVRKRALRLMADIYRIECSGEIRVQASSSIVRSILDDEPSMQELTIEIIADLWFDGLRAEQCTTSKAASYHAEQLSPARTTPDKTESNDDSEALSVLVSVADLFQGRNSPLEEVLKRIAGAMSGEALRARVAMFVDELARSMISAQEPSSGNDLLRYARTLSLFVRIIPTSLSIRTAKSLLACIAEASSPTSLPALAHLLNTFSSAIPAMHKTTLSFARQLQAALRPLVSQPTPFFTILQELLRCYCLVIRHHTHDFDILVKTLQQCIKLVRGVLRKARTCKPVESIDRDDAVVLRLAAHLVEHGDFESIQKKSLAYKDAIKQMTNKTIAEEMCDLLFQLYVRRGYSIHSLHGLRSVFRGYPHLMITASASATIFHILAEGPMQEKATVLRTVAEIMIIDERKSTQTLSTKNDVTLVSTSANVPASFDVLRNYLKPSIGLIVEPTLQPLALEILEHAVLRGLCHPMECLTALVSLQTLQENQVIQHDAQRLYKHLLGKTNSVNFRYAKCARQAWEFQVALKGIMVRGTTSSGEALFQQWYNLIREHQPKPARMELLRALLKAFEVNIAAGECAASNVSYTRFVAENVVTLDLRSPEETNLVTSALQDVIIGAGSQLRTSAQEELEVDGEDVSEEDEGDRSEDEVQHLIALGRMATIVSLALLTRQHIGSHRHAQTQPQSASTPTRLQDLSSLPGTCRQRVEGLKLARAELGHLEALLDSLEDEQDDDDC